MQGPGGSLHHPVGGWLAEADGEGTDALAAMFWRGGHHPVLAALSTAASSRSGSRPLLDVFDALVALIFR